MSETINLREKEWEHFNRDLEKMKQEPWRLEQRLKATSYSYEKMIGFTVCRDLRVVTRPDSTKPRRLWKRQVAMLELGFGLGLGIDVALNRFSIEPSGFVGIEVIPKHYEEAKAKYPNCHFYLLGGAPNELPDLLNSWADAGVRFNVVLARHMMEHIPNAVDILKGVRRILYPSNERREGVYIQVTPYWEDDPEEAHINNQPVKLVRRIGHTTKRGKKVRVMTSEFKDEGWPVIFKEAGITPTEGGMWNAHHHHHDIEFFMSGIRQGD